MFMRNCINQRMGEEMKESKTFSIFSALLIIIIVCISSSLIIGVTNAAIFTYGSNYDYSAVTLPNNSYVHQGENITQGYRYDLSGVYGWSGILGHWKSENNIGYTIPDTTVNLNDYNARDMYLDPSLFPVGQWYQIDKFSADEDVNSFGRGNNYAFYVVKQKDDKIYNESGFYTPGEDVEVKETVYNTSVFVFNGTVNEEIQITVSVTETSYARIEPPEEQNGTPNSAKHTILLPTTITQESTPVQNNPINGVVQPEIITNATPINPIIPIISIVLVGVFLFRRY